jgi:hypothetical protein
MIANGTLNPQETLRPSHQIDTLTARELLLFAVDWR